MNDRDVGSGQPEPVSHRAVTFLPDGFWGRRLARHRAVTLPATLEQCRATGRIDNFVRAAERRPGTFSGLVFNDSDVYKVVEGAAYALAAGPDPDWERAIGDVVTAIGRAQEPDGYLMTYFTLKAPDRKWTEMSAHEMYCGGHLMEAAVAWHQATGRTDLLQVAERLAQHYMARFGPGRRHWVPDHPEVELALVRLAEETHNDAYADFAHWLLEERGHGHGRGEVWDHPGWGAAYCQDAEPVRDLARPYGHAVRAMYLYAAMADMVRLGRAPEYGPALDRLWRSLVERHLYITGGIGSRPDGEAFGDDFDLPNDTAYCETCAAAGMILWNHRLFRLWPESRFPDLIELELYNGFLAGVSLAGDRFFYVNPLASRGTHHRQPWFETACCPTQVARIVPSVGQYVYAVAADHVWVNQFIAGTARLQVAGRPVEVVQATDYPWDGRVTLTVRVDAPLAFTLALRIPGWSRGHRVLLNGLELPGAPVAGYRQVRRVWQDGDTVTGILPMPVERVHVDPRVAADRGQVALKRGPVVYCLEGVDNPDPDAWFIDPAMRFTTIPDVAELDGATVLEGTSPTGHRIRAVPYYAWDNREPGPMAVFVREAR